MLKKKGKERGVWGGTHYQRKKRCARLKEPQGVETAHEKSLREGTERESPAKFPKLLERTRKRKDGGEGWEGHIKR